jgi:diaminopimelate decarboxylase
MTTRRLDDSLSIQDGRLFVEERDAARLLEEFGSPLFVVSEDQLRRNVRRFQAAFAAGWPEGSVRVMPAAKANWVTAVQRVLADEGCGADVYSAGELSVALAAGFEPRTISVNGVPKTEEHVRRTVEVGARLTVDSAEEVDALESVLRGTGRRARVALRLRPVVSGFVDHSDFAAEGLVPTRSRRPHHKGGLGAEEAIPVGRRLLAMPGVDLVRLHQHQAATTRRRVTGKSR